MPFSIAIRLRRARPLSSAESRLSPLTDVCGFTAGDNRAISDGHGRFDIFEIACDRCVAHDAGPTEAVVCGRMVPARSFFEAEAFRYSLATQPDGSKSMVRTPESGAAQPVVDGVTELPILALG